MIMIKDNNGTEIYNNIIKPLISKSLLFPNVNLTIIKGDGQYTESNYSYIYNVHMQIHINLNIHIPKNKYKYKYTCKIHIHINVHTKIHINTIYI